MNSGVSPFELQESKSDTTLYDVWLRILDPLTSDFPLVIPIHDHEPDSVEIKKAKWCDAEGLFVKATSDFKDKHQDSEDGFENQLWVSVDSPVDEGGDEGVDPVVFHWQMTHVRGKVWKIEIPQADIGVDLRGLRVNVYSNHGGQFNDRVRFNRRCDD